MPKTIVAEKRQLNPLELANEERRVRSVIKTPEGQQALRNVLGHDFEFMSRSGISEGEAKPTVAVLVPSRDVPSKQTQDAFQVLAAFSKPYANLLPLPVRNGTIVHWVRNSLLAELRKSGKHFDYVLFMDDDMQPAKDDLVKLLEHKKDAISAATVGRVFPNLPTFKFFNQEALEAGFVKPGLQPFVIPAEWGEGKEEGLMKVDAIGTGFSLYSRKALDAAGSYYLTCQHERRYLGMSDEAVERVSGLRQQAFKESGNAWWFENLKSPNGDDEFGEDVSLCFKLWHSGIASYVDTNVRTGHIGAYPYTLGDFYINRALIRREKEATA